MLVLLCVIINLFGVFLSAAFWNKLSRFRMLPIATTTLSGVLYTLFNPAVEGLLHGAQIIVISFVIGIGFYFVVWIQCED